MDECNGMMESESNCLLTWQSLSLRISGDVYCLDEESVFDKHRANRAV